MNLVNRWNGATLALLASAALLTACNRTDDGRTAGQKVDATVASAENKVAQAGDKAREMGREAGAKIENAAGAVADKSRDIAITGEVKAKLAADDKLSALAINVDTDAGRVVLRGTAPDTAARDRATELARNVDGVGTVDNELKVQPAK